jgi:hypothetical protein
MRNVGAQRLVLSSLAMSAACLVSSDALACVHPRNQTSIFFTSVPSYLASPIVAQVRILKVLNPLADGSAYSGHARVEKVIRGTIKGDVIRLVSHSMSTCDRPFRVGDAGLVVGSIQYGAGELPAFAALPAYMREQGGTP